MLIVEVLVVPIINSFMKKGLFITIYGINNIGKSTHSKRLVKSLTEHGYKAVYVKYPIYDLEPTGPAINKVLRTNGEQQISEQELQSLFMQNRKDYEPKIREMLEDGFIVVAEDYVGTGVAWGTAKGLEQEWVEKLNDGLLKEDFSILMVGQRSMFAKEKEHIHEADDNLVNRVGIILQSMAKKNGWHQVEVQEMIADTAVLMWKEVEEFLKYKLANHKEA